MDREKGQKGQPEGKGKEVDDRGRDEASVVSLLCRICYDNEKEEDLITPCNCKGTVAFVHRTCLETWLGESNTTKCELCHQIFKTERTPKFTSTQSIWHWCRRSPGGISRGVRGDVLACTIITPLSIIITYVCLFSAEYYSQKKFVQVPAARWTSVSLLIMIAIMLIGYYLWVYSVIRIHARVWYNWWQRNCIVRYISNNSLNVAQSTQGTQAELQGMSSSNLRQENRIGSNQTLPIIVTHASTSGYNIAEDIV